MAMNLEHREQTLVPIVITYCKTLRHALRPLYLRAVSPSVVLLLIIAGFCSLCGYGSVHGCLGTS